VSIKKFGFVMVYFNQSTIHLKDELGQMALEDFSSDGIEEFSLEESVVDQILGERAYSGGDIPIGLIDEVEEHTNSKNEVTVKYYFHDENYFERMNAFALEINDIFPDLPTVCEELPVQDWNLEWKKFYRPIIVSEDLEIIPEWLKHARVAQSKNSVYINPGMGFGTGTHETTYLCLKLFDEIKEKFLQEMSCLDFGCGSGILGVAAIKMKKMRVSFCDIDREALDNCLQNLVLNFDGDKLEGTELVIRDRYVPTKFNLIFANILEPVLKLEKEIILNSLEKNGWLIVSGLLNNQVDSILNEYSSLKYIKLVSKGDWSAILFRNEKV
jgi:ribosomal protein L11 methyltransferase